MKLSHFKFDLPTEQIAQYPLENRDDSRMMVVDRKTGKIEHKMFKDILGMFDEGDVFVANDTKVFPARLYGNKLYFGENDELVAEVIDNTTSRGRTLRFLFDGSKEEFMAKIVELGETPLPRYIERGTEDIDIERFQTIYAKTEGAVAAPTAGLHFSKQLMKRMEIKGVDMAYITLHIGLGTFREVEVEDITKHKVDSEQLIIENECVERVNRAKSEGRRICAIGSTSMRAMENSVSTTNTLKPYKGWTNKFIFPKYDFRVADSLLTNFHTQQSTLLMLQSAFAGHELIMEAYNEAIKEGYRFYAYGDALLIK